MIEVGSNLNIASQQDTNDYNAKNQSSGFGVSTGLIGGVTGSISKGKTDSSYASVTDQAGIFAGKDGFDITVGKNTDLKGAVISSEAPAIKNALSTGTLTFSDIQNKAEYSASSIGVNYNAGKDANGKDVEKKDLGLTPNIGVTASGNADSITKSAISAGTIVVRSGNTDLSNLSRDTTNTVNALGKIFDKKTVQEKQELANLFGQEVFKAIGDLGLKEGSPEKAMLDAFAGGLMAKLGGGSFASGAVGAGFNQLLMNELKNIKDPAAMQWASAIVGAAATKVVGGNAQTGASVAASETKNNYLTHEQYAKYQAQLEELEDELKTGSITKEEYNAAVKEVNDSWSKIDKEQNKKWWSEHQIIIDGKNPGPITIPKETVGVNMDGTDATLSPAVVIVDKKPGIVETFIYDPKASVTENVHKLLSIGGFTPLAPVSEGTNAVIYLAEGDNESAAMSAFAAIPGMKIVAVAKGAIKLVPETEEAIKFVQAYTKEVKAGENATNVVKGSGKATTVEYGEQFTKVDGKKALKPNIEYTTSEGYKYATDGNGRISSVEANLEKGAADRNQYAQRTVGGDDRLPTDDGGHLIASIFKGSGEIDNLVPMDSTLNRSEYKALENTWKTALNDGKTVNVKIEPTYNTNSLRPAKFDIEYTIDGKKYEVNLKNYEGGK
nr:putative ribonuclease YeeF [Sporomusa silvacetica DSM 10669]